MCVCIYISIKQKYIKKKIILDKMLLELTGTVEVTGAAASFPDSGTDKLAVQIQKHTVITKVFFIMQYFRQLKFQVRMCLLVTAASLARKIKHTEISAVGLDFSPKL